MKKYLPIFIVAALVLGIRGAFAMGSAPEQKTDSATRLKPALEIPHYAAGIRTTIMHFILKNKISPSEGIASKLDFSEPGSPTYNDKSELTVFVSRDHFKNHVPEEKMSMLFTAPDRLEALKKDSKFYFTLGNRVEGAGSDLPDLLMVIVGPKDHNTCGDINEGMLKDRKVPKLPVAISLTPNNQPVSEEQIIALPPIWGACYEGNDGKLYYMLVLLEL